MNVISFYELFADKENSERFNNSEWKSENDLDVWIVTLLSNLEKEVSKRLDAYELDSAARPIADFIDDLSTWYVRRSRDRFKGEDKSDKENAMHSLHLYY